MRANTQTTTKRNLPLVLGIEFDDTVEGEKTTLFFPSVELHEEWARELNELFIAQQERMNARSPIRMSLVVGCCHWGSNSMIHAETAKTDSWKNGANSPVTARRAALGMNGRVGGFRKTSTLPEFAFRSLPSSPCISPAVSPRSLNRRSADSTPINSPDITATPHTDSADQDARSRPTTRLRETNPQTLHTEKPD